MDEVLSTVRTWLPEADGFTVSGGEPFEQSEALKGLLKGLRAAAPGSDILVYSGFSWEKIANLVTSWHGLIDVLISDPFSPGAGQTLAWRGSDNQRMHMLTPLGRSRYANWNAAPRSALPQALDVFFQNGEAWMAGIPTPGSIKALQKRLAEAGFTSSTSQSLKSAEPDLPVFA